MLRDSIFGNEQFNRKMRFSAQFLMGTVLVVALSTLAEWHFGVNVFRQPIENSIATNPATAVCFILTSIAFFFKIKSTPADKIANAFALSALIIGALKILDLALDLSFSVDQLLYKSKLKEAANLPINKMSFFTALNFLLLGISILTIHSTSGKLSDFAMVGFLIVAIIGLAFIIGYIYRVPEFFRVLQVNPMSLTTATCFIISIIAFLLVNPDKGFMKRITSSLSGSSAARILIPVAILTPAFIGYLHIQSEWHNLISNSLSIGLSATGIIIIFLVFIYYTAGLINKQDVMKLEAESKLKKVNQNLEIIVEARTSELRTKNTELSISEKKYRNLFENSLASIIVTDLTSQRPITINNVGVEMFGYQSMEDFLENYEPTRHFVEFSDRERIFKLLIEAGVAKNIVLKMKKLDGTIFWANVFVGLDRKNNIVESVMVDITSQIEAQNELVEKVKELQVLNQELENYNFVSSHDLQEPLRKIRNFASILVTQETNLSKKGTYYLNTMAETSEKMQNLLEDLAAYSELRVTGAKFEKIDLTILLKEVLSAYKFIIEKKKATIQFNTLCTAKVIKTQIRKLFINLIDNSIKFSHPDRQLILTINAETKTGKDLISPQLEPDLMYCHLTFIDNGIGFAQEYSERIFEIFERLNPRDEYPGTGIGLSVCKKAVENHHGIITAKGKVNDGARFDIYIPIEYHTN